MYKKINIFMNDSYLCSTGWSRTCKEAISKIKKGEFLDIAGKKVFIPKDAKITAHFDKMN